MLSGCAEEFAGEPFDNERPTVWLSGAPPHGTDTSYRVHLYWGGWDPDGEVAYFEYVITDNDNGIFDPADTTAVAGVTSPWKKVYANDSVFVFSADVIADSTDDDLIRRFERTHTFFIRSVDEDGLTSLEPAYRSFTAWTLSPTVSITFPRRFGTTPTLVPAVTTYRWNAKDYAQDMEEAQEPDSVRWLLHEVNDSRWDPELEFIRNNPDSIDWYPWHDYNAPADSGHYWTTPPTDYGTYWFAVQAKDEAGAITPVLDEKYNLRRVRVGQRNTGPIVALTNEYIGKVSSSIANPPAVIIDLPANVPIEFRWTANAEHYGGILTGYRYGWDINDLNNPEEWEVDYTPFTGRGEPSASSKSRTFFFGSHRFDLEVADNTGAVTRIEIKINIIPFTMNRSVLLVDDFAPKRSGIDQTRGAVPNDEEHDAFWERALENVLGFSMQDDQITVEAGRPLSLVKFSNYKSIIWNVMGGYDTNALNRPKFYDLVRFRSKDWEFTGSGKIEPNVLVLFMKSGGHLLLCGHQALSQALPDAGSWGSIISLKYPIALRYELEGDQDGIYTDQSQTGDFVGDEGFAFRDACLTILDMAYLSNRGQIRGAQSGCRVDLIRRNDLVNESLREALPMDPRFPRLELRPEVSNPGRAYHVSSKGLATELYNPPYFAFCEFAELSWPRPCFEPIYGNGCLNEDSPMYNAPIAFWSAAYANVIPDIEDGIAARSVFLGFEPYYFKPSQVKEMLDIILFDEWQLPRF